MLQELFWVHFLGCRYCSNGTKIHLDLALITLNIIMLLGVLLKINTYNSWALAGTESCIKRFILICLMVKISHLI